MPQSPIQSPTITAGLAIVAMLVTAAFIGCIAWAILASRGPDPPELRELDWWENTVIYQVYPRSFKDTDGDGIGDLKGIISELHQFVYLGVGALCLAPIFSSPLVDFGYDVSNYYDIHHEYGTMADFEKLVQKAHELGLKVILDHVPNHASIESEYFKLSEAGNPAYKDFFVWADTRPTNSGSLVPSNWISQYGGTVWEWSGVHQQFYLHQFAKEQADFNFRAAAVREEMTNILRFWLQKGVDGFKMNAAPHLFETAPYQNGTYPDEPLSKDCSLTSEQPGHTTQEHVKDLVELYDVVYEWREFVDNWQRMNNISETKILLTQGLTNTTMAMRYYGDEAGRFGSHIPIDFDLMTSLSDKSDARDFAYVILQWLTYMPHGAIANWIFGNHDNSRVASRFRTDMVDGLNALLLILPGVAVMYQGEEIGMRDGFVSLNDTADIVALNMGDSDNLMRYSRDPARTPYHWDNSTSAGFSTNESTWLPIAEDYLEINLAAQKLADRSHYKVYQALTSLRRQPALSHGNHHVQALTRHTLVLVRYLRTHDTYTLVFNVGNQTDAVDLKRVKFLNGVLKVYASSVHSSRVSGDKLPVGEISLQAGDALLLQSAPTS